MRRRLVVLISALLLLAAPQLPFLPLLLGVVAILAAALLGSLLSPLAARTLGRALPELPIGRLTWWVRLYGLRVGVRALPCLVALACASLLVLGALSLAGGQQVLLGLRQVARPQAAMAAGYGGTITPGGPPVSVSVTIPGDNA